mgnify:FL=1
MDFFDNHYLFSETYLREYIKLQKKLATPDLARNYRTIKEWHDECDERNWFRDYIRPVIDTVGFKYPPITNNTVVLYTNKPAAGDTPVAVLYAANKNEDLSSDSKGRYYAYETVSAAKANGVDWAMLTNGYQWRIYNVKNISPYENYLEVNIENSMKNGNTPDEAFSLFHLFFNASTYYRNESGELFIEGIKDKSDETAEQVEDLLRGKAEEILKDICYGFKETMGYESYDRATCRMIYQDAITLLFRMLFFGYAESRGLLPRQVGDMEYKQNSFFKLCEEAKNTLNAGKAYESKNDFDFYNRLDEHLRIYVDQTYNGGLFSNNDKPILREYKVANGWMMKCLAEIAYKKDKKTNVYSEKIEYKDLSVRNLGSIYEGLLEFNLFIAEEEMVKRTTKNKTQYLKTSTLTLKKADEPNIIKIGDIYLSQDATERKDTGSYYTPEDVVEYIVSNTVGKKLEELKSELGILLRRSYEEIAIEPTESGRKRIQKQIDEETLNFIENKILSLSIIDSAMGSGHFLVNAAYKVANGIVEIWGQNNWETEEEIHVDVGYWKRKVVENCIYGIDINPLAVTLTKLSLWLISADNDKALSFIDHHLKEGNSIIGTDRYHVKTSGETGPIFDVSYEKYIAPVKSKYAELNRVGSLTKEDVERQKEIYNDIQTMLEVIKKKYDYFLASQYTGGIKDEVRFGELLRSKDIKDFAQEEMDDLWQLAKEKKFFHWELEFPEILLDGGFDIAIGNPPYVEVQETEFEYLNLASIKSKNLYSYMIENNLAKLNYKGFYGFIIPLSLITSPKMESIKDYIIDESSKIWVNSYGIRPGKIFKNVDQRICIIYGIGNSDQSSTELHTSKYIIWNTKERKNLFNDVKYYKSIIPNHSKVNIYKIGTEIERDLLDKLLRINKTVKDFLLDVNDEIIKEDFTNYIYYHSAVRYWTKALDFVPEFVNEGVERQSSKYKKLNFKPHINKFIPLALINSSLFFWYWIITSDCRDLTIDTITNFHIDLEYFDQHTEEQLSLIGMGLMKNYIEHSEVKQSNMSTIGQVSYREFHPKYSKHLIDKIDDILGIYYGFNQAERKFIKEYDIKFRLGE